MQVAPRCAARKDGVLLCEGRVHKWSGFSPQAKMFDVAHNPDDLPRPRLVHGVRVVAQKYLLSDGIFVGEKPARKSLVYGNDPGCGVRVVLIQVASFDQRNL